MITNRKTINDTVDIQALLHLVKNHQRGLITNFFLEPFKHGIWAKRGEFDLISVKDTAFLVHSNNGFKTLFYLSPNLPELEESLNIFIEEDDVEKYVVDLVGHENMLADAAGVFSRAGFIKRSTLVRMSRAGNAAHCPVDDSVSFADLSELSFIETLFQQYFDKYVEQLPMYEELMSWAEKKQCLICRNGDKIEGFLIFDSTLHTAYLRYWFVHPDCRNRNIGSQLMHRFFSANEAAKRILFWVIETNKNAIKRYAHYGFTPEKIRDIVLTYNIVE